MMSPPLAFEDPVIGPILKANESLLRGDLLLSLYIMFEMVKGQESFYFPYLQILPEPGSVSQWTDEQLQELENDELVFKAKNKITSLRNIYSRSIVKLCNDHPDQLPLESYTYDRFLFAWYSVQARAFGKRLKWTAMVPFADCLNHSNLQTKYDYDVDGNGFFRLFPSGANAYPCGTEVFNSYGRRHNENLLMDYGFAMLDNEWDQVELLLSLPRSTGSDNNECYSSKRSLLHTLLGQHSYCSFFLQLGGGGGGGGTSSASSTGSGWGSKECCLPLDALAFLRIVCLEASEMDRVMSLPIVLQAQEQRREAEALSRAARDCEPETLIFNSRSGALSSSSSGTAANSPVFVFSIANELRAVQRLKDELSLMVAARRNSPEQDEARLQQLASQDIDQRQDQDQDQDKDRDRIKKGRSNSSSEQGASAGNTGDSRWREQCAVAYRLTRKRIIDGTLTKLSLIEKRLQGGISSETLIDGIVAATQPHKVGPGCYRKLLVYVDQIEQREREREREIDR